jgi:hypothetical protein
MKKDIIHPNMIKCALLCNDPTWKSIFENLAYGKCPSGIYLNKNYINCATKGKEFSYKIDARKPVQELWREISCILKDFVSVDQQSFTIGQGHTTWTQVKKKVIRDTLLEKYVLDKSVAFNLSMQVSRKLLSMLIIGLMFKTISSKNIEYRDGYIHHIDGFRYEPKKILLTKNIFNSKIRDDTIIDIYPTTKYLSEFWSLYIQELKAK